MDLPSLSALVVLFSLTMYSLLDGFDLGVGVLVLFGRAGDRDCMVRSLSPTWDGNETWLIMAGVALLGLFPVAYGVLLPALYLPLVTMLLALGFRGVAFEFRVQPGARRAWWDRAFGIGSLVAALCQGLVAGALIEGVSVSGHAFSGSVLDVLRPFPLLMAVTLVSGYMALGGGWLYLKTDGLLQRHFARKALTCSVFAFAALGMLAIAGAAVTQSALQDDWRQHGLRHAAVVLLFYGALYAAVSAARSGSERAPLLWCGAAFVLALTGFAAAVWPDVVPFRISAELASSPARSQALLLWGFAVVAPMVLVYSALGYRVFRGKTPLVAEDES
ncbi:MAG: Cytochrome bd2 ubiquinol oxidase subunit [Ramlibacter sp.]|nr:Cytochrome bd2 ubiquinol oxidase subunit [Ramlibacter sp.]